MMTRASPALDIFLSNSASLSTSNTAIMSGRVAGTVQLPAASAARTGIGMEGEKAWVEAIATDARNMERRERVMVGECILRNKIRVLSWSLLSSGGMSGVSVVVTTDAAVVTVCRPLGLRARCVLHVVEKPGGGLQPKSAGK